jgi:hypothetical protein
MFIETLFTIAKLWNDSLQLKNWLRKCVYRNNRVLFGHEKEWN